VLSWCSSTYAWRDRRPSEFSSCPSEVFLLPLAESEKRVALLYISGFLCIVIFKTICNKYFKQIKRIQVNFDTVDFDNISISFFLPISLCQKIPKTNFMQRKAAKSSFLWKSAHLILVKLSPGISFNNILTHSFYTQKWSGSQLLFHQHLCYGINLENKG